MHSSIAFTCQKHYVMIKAKDNEAKLNFHSFGFGKQHFSNVKPQRNMDVNIIRGIPIV